MASRVDKVDRVELDGLVVLKIVKHCQDSLPVMVAGSLLGLDRAGGSLEVTHSFPLPADVDQSEGDSYQVQMLKALREVNIENNQVGWYQAAYLGTFCSRDVVRQQFEFQRNLGPNSVMLIYDPVRSTSGTLSLTAYRLTESFMSAYKGRELKEEDITSSQLSSGKLFEELPVHIHNPKLTQAYLVDMQRKSRASLATAVTSGSSSAGGFRGLVAGGKKGTAGRSGELGSDLRRLDLSSATFLEKQVELMTEKVDELTDMQGQLQFVARKAATQKRYRDQWLQQRSAENEERASRGLPPLPMVDTNMWFFKPLPEDRVDRLDVLLSSAQVGKYCDGINGFAGTSLGKLFVAGGLHKG